MTDKAKQLGNETAYPEINWELSGDGQNVGTYSRFGLTKREYFAGMAMQGLLTDKTEVFSEMAEDAVRCADLLLEELSKEN